MPDFPKIQIGQPLYYQECPRGQMPVLHKVVVKKVGKKYFYLEGYLGRFPFELQTMRCTQMVSGGIMVQLYHSPEEIGDGYERTAIIALIRKHLEWGGVNTKSSLEQLRQAAAALGIEAAPRQSFTIAPDTGL
jgi:hypothetical protein